MQRDTQMTCEASAAASLRQFTGSPARRFTGYATSETESSRELNLPRQAVLRRDRPECGAGHACIGAGQIGAVQRVVDLGAQLHPQPAAEIDVLQEPEV